MLKTVKYAFREPGTNKVKAVVEFWVSYEIVNEKIKKGYVSFYVYGPGEFEWEDWLREWKTASGKRPVYKPSEVARLVNKYTGSSINYEPIRHNVEDIIENLQYQHNYKLFQEEKKNIEEEVQKAVTESIRNIMKKHHLTFNQEKDEIRCYEDSYDITTYLFKGESHGNNFSIYLDGVLESAYETIKNE